MCAFACLDIASGAFLDYINMHTIKGDYGRSNYICNQTHQDVLIFGSSRAIHHYDPDVFGEHLGMTCYNCGEDGMGIILSYGRYRMISKRYNPKLIIYDIESGFDILKGDNTKYLGYLMPFYNREGIDSIFFNVDANERFKMRSSLYRYNSKFLNIIAQYLSKSSVTARIYKFSPLQSSMVHEPMEKRETTSCEYDKIKLYYLTKFITDCRKNGTDIIFTVSPWYKASPNVSIFAPVYALCKKYHIQIFNHFCDGRFVHDKQLFHDEAHLNQKGAELFSKMLAEEISLKKKK